MAKIALAFLQKDVRVRTDEKAADRMLMGAFQATLP